MQEIDYNNSFSYFENRQCRYYPCHDDMEHINCLFCYCPLYEYDSCPGSFSLIEKEGRVIKSCMNCDFPHRKENYGQIIKCIKEHI